VKSDPVRLALEGPDDVVSTMAGIMLRPARATRWSPAPWPRPSAQPQPPPPGRATPHT